MRFWTSLREFSPLGKCHPTFRCIICKSHLWFRLVLLAKSLFVTPRRQRRAVWLWPPQSPSWLPQAPPRENRHIVPISYPTQTDHAPSRINSFRHLRNHIRGNLDHKSLHGCFGHRCWIEEDSNPNGDRYPHCEAIQIRVGQIGQELIGECPHKSHFWASSCDNCG